MLLPDTSPFWRWQEEYRPAAFLLALSGGRDSMALLQALVLQRARRETPVSPQKDELCSKAPASDLYPY